MISLLEYSEEDNCLFGKVVGIKSLISYEGDSIQALKRAFEVMIDEYLDECKARGVEPEKPYKGTFNVRINSDLHRSIATYATKHDKTLNAAVEEAIADFIKNK